jgi:hypothetical protein
MVRSLSLLERPSLPSCVCSLARPGPEIGTACSLCELSVSSSALNCRSSPPTAPHLLSMGPAQTVRCGGAASLISNQAPESDIEAATTTRTLPPCWSTTTGSNPPSHTRSGMLPVQCLGDRTLGHRLSWRASTCLFCIVEPARTTTELQAVCKEHGCSVADSTLAGALLSPGKARCNPLRAPILPAREPRHPQRHGCRRVDATLCSPLR